MKQLHLAHKTLNHVQALRGVAAFLVMLAHLYDSELKYSPDQLLGRWTIYGNAGVDLFFLISGFIMVYVTSNRDRGVKPAFEFLFSRACRIYPLYWIVTLAVFAVALIRCRDQSYRNCYNNFWCNWCTRNYSWKNSWEWSECYWVSWTKWIWTSCRSFFLKTFRECTRLGDRHACSIANSYRSYEGYPR